MAVAICTDANVFQFVMTHFNENVHRYLLFIKDILQAAEPDVIKELGNAEVLETQDNTALFRNESLLTAIA